MSSNKSISDSYRCLEHVQVTRPEFIEQLKERGLNEEEIRYCCLEVLGVKE